MILELEDTGTTAWLLLAALALAAIAVREFASPAARQRRARWRRHRMLAAANGLTDDETRALWRLARTARLAEPAVAFVRPSLLDSGHAELDGDTLAALRRKLFGADADAPSSR